MDIVAVRIGDKYGPEYETYLEKNYQNITLSGFVNHIIQT